MFSFKKILLFILVFGIAAFFMISHYFSDLQINKYPDMDVVKQDHAIERGWIPSILPASAFNIAETHNIDTNEIFGSFYYKSIDEAAFVRQLHIVSDMNQTYQWENFLFKINTETKLVKYRNKPVQSEER